MWVTGWGRGTVSRGDRANGRRGGVRRPARREGPTDGLGDAHVAAGELSYSRLTDAGSEAATGAIRLWHTISQDIGK